MAFGRSSLGHLLAGQRRTSEAEEQDRQALATWERLAAEFPAVPEYRRGLAGAHNNLGLLLVAPGRVLEAEVQYRQALTIQEKLTADFPRVPLYRGDVALSHNNLGILLAGQGKRPEAEQQHRQALAIQEKLAADFPAVPQYRVELGGSCCNFGVLVRDSGRPGESLEWFEKAIRTLTLVYEQDHRSVEAREFLRNSHWNRAMASDRLRKFTEAIRDWDRAIELSPIAVQPQLRAERAKTRLRMGRVAAAVAEVDELTRNASWSGDHWYDFACVYAVASGEGADKKQAYADRAMDLLRKAVQAGFNNAAHMASDTDLDPIRGREDLKKLIEGLAKPSTGKPEAKR